MNLPVCASLKLAFVPEKTLNIVTLLLNTSIHHTHSFVEFRAFKVYTMIHFYSISDNNYHIYNYYIQCDKILFFLVGYQLMPIFITDSFLDS